VRAPFALVESLDSAHNDFEPNDVAPNQPRRSLDAAGDRSPSGARTEGCPSVREYTSSRLCDSASMSSSEQAVDELLAATYAVERALAERRGQLALEPGWSGVTFELRATQWRASIGPNAERRLGFSGYVDGEYRDLGGLAWIVDLIRDGEGWKVQRGLHLNRNTTDYQEKVSELPTALLSGSRELASAIPHLVEELFDISPPDA
jgi:hypothetical protein